MESHQKCAEQSKNCRWTAQCIWSRKREKWNWWQDRNPTRRQHCSNPIPQIIQAAIELCLKLAYNKLEFWYFPDQKGTACQFGRLSLQPNPNTTKKNEKALHLNNLLYVDNRAFLLATLVDRGLTNHPWPLLLVQTPVGSKVQTMTEAM